jgi:hypothetical protein
MATTNKTQWAHGKHLPAQYNNETGVYGPLACGHYDIVADTAGHSCNSEVIREDQIANARLISAAPDLLAVAKLVQRYFDVDYEESYQDTDEILKGVERAIYKALGKED